MARKILGPLREKLASYSRMIREFEDLIEATEEMTANAVREQMLFTLNMALERATACSEYLKGFIARHEKRSENGSEFPR